MQIDDGTHNDRQLEVELPMEYIEATSLRDLIQKNLGMHILTPSFDYSSCILAPTNDLCDNFNDAVVHMIPRECGKHTAINRK